MFERWKSWRYPVHEKRAAEADDLRDFQAWFEGPWTPEIARKMPLRKLHEGPGGKGLRDDQTRRVVENELAQRNRIAVWSLVVTALGVIVAVAQLAR